MPVDSKSLLGVNHGVHCSHRGSIREVAFWQWYSEVTPELPEAASSPHRGSHQLLFDKPLAITIHDERRDGARSRILSEGETA